MALPFKMKGWSPFTKKTDDWVTQIFNSERRGQEAEKRIKKQKDSGKVKEVQDTMSKGNKGAVPLLPE